jgi:hypothetical protein
MEKSNSDWIVSCQEPEVLKKFPGPVAWVNQCLRCGEEEPVLGGPVAVMIYQAKLFIKMHRHCRASRPCMTGRKGGTNGYERWSDSTARENKTADAGRKEIFQTDGVKGDGEADGQKATEGRTKRTVSMW